MGQFFATLSKGTIVLIALTAGILFIVLSDPPHTLCESQIKVFQESQKGFLYPKEETKFKVKTDYKLQIERCKTGNSTGACFDLFMNYRKLLQQLQGTQYECQPEVASISEVKNSIWAGLDLFIRMAWGEKPPGQYENFRGWFDDADLSLYCALKDMAVHLYGEKKWETFREVYFKELPGIANLRLKREEVWERSLINTQKVCRR